MLSIGLFQLTYNQNTHASLCGDWLTQGLPTSAFEIFRGLKLKSSLSVRASLEPCLPNSLP